MLPGRTVVDASDEYIRRCSGADTDEYKKVQKESFRILKKSSVPIKTCIINSSFAYGNWGSTSKSIIETGKKPTDRRELRPIRRHQLISTVGRCAWGERASMFSLSFLIAAITFYCCCLLSFANFKTTVLHYLKREVFSGFGNPGLSKELAYKFLFRSAFFTEIL